MLDDPNDLPNLRLSPETFDLFLSKGWFRMVHRMFTADQIYYQDGMHDIIWIRLDLEKFEWTSSHKKLLKAIKNLSLIHHNFCFIEPQCEQVYELYRQSVSFDAPISINDFLYGNHFHMEFNTQSLSLYNGQELVGRGYFDIGHQSAAGIMNFYHPQYKKYSIGRVLFLLKIQHCISNGIRYFYPGYISPTVPNFDYKTSIHSPSTEFYDFEADEWIPMMSKPNLKSNC